MHVKRVLHFLPFPAKLRLVWDRVTFSRLTTCYFLFSVFHFVVQLAFQVKAFTINADAAHFLYSILIQGNATNSSSFPVFQSSEFRMCDRVPSTFSAQSCQLLWNGTQSVNNTIGSPNQANAAFDLATASSSNAANAPTSTYSRIPVSSLSQIQTSTRVEPSTVTITVTPIATSSSVTKATTSPSPGNTNVDGVKAADLGNKELDDDKDDEELEGLLSEHVDDLPVVIKRRTNTKRDWDIMAFTEDGQVKVKLDGMGYNNMPAVLDSKCLWALNWPVSILNNTKREDVVFIAFQFWVLGMSVVAILNESIPHIIASLCTHILATSWAGFQISHTASFRSQFTQLVTNGACRPASLLPNYWMARGQAEIASLILNVIALFVSGLLTWRLIKLFGWQTFKRVGASLTINRIYKIVLMFSITIQISMFFMVVTVGLWIDQLFNGLIAQFAEYSTLYKITFTVTLFLLLPWMIMGWFGVRRELRAPMFVFLVLSIIYMIGWAVMFLSTTFRWTFVTWRFFALMASASVALTLMSFILGVICRLNFGKGLSRYLNAQEPLAGEDSMPTYTGADGDMEKVAFPSHEKPVPTWSATFGSGSEVPLPRQMFAPSRKGGPRMGPRFFNSSAEPFESQSNPSYPTTPSPAHTRALSDDSYQGAPLIRRDTHESDRSFANSSTSRPISRSNSQSSLESNGSYSGSNGKRWVIE